MHSFYQSVKRNLIIVSIPNAGHIKILARMANVLRQSDANLNIHFILTSWLGHEIRENYINELKNACGNRRKWS